MRQVLPSLAILLAISAGSLFFRLGDLPLSGADEPRYARIAQEMLNREDWVTPTLQGKPWLEKPPLYYWISAPFFSGAWENETAARVGPALCALFTALAVFWAGSALFSIRAGFWGASILLTSLGLAGFGRSASTDMPFTFCLTLALSILVVSLWKDLGWRVLPAYFFLGLAVLGKGPVALILAAGIGACVWYLDDRATVLGKWHVIPGLLIAAAVSIPWYWMAFLENGFGFISIFFINHNIARYISDVHHHTQPFWYYLPVLVALLFPWSGWLPVLFANSPAARFRRWREWDSVYVCLAGWCIIPVLFFSLSDSKLAGYVLPSLPPLALLLGVQISRAIEGAKGSRLRGASWLHFGLSACMAAASPTMFRKEYGSWEIGLLLAGVILIPALYSLWCGLRSSAARAFGATALQGFLIVVVLAQFAFPQMAIRHSTRDIALKTMQARRDGEPIITYRFFHHSLHYYTGYAVAGKLDDGESLIRFARKNPGSLVVTNKDGMLRIYKIKELNASRLGEQGKFHLLRISPR